MEIETVSHMFWECMYVQTFWMKLEDCLNENQITVNITFKTTTFGIQERFTNENKLKNVMILLAKYCIFINKCKKTVRSWQAFKHNMPKRIGIEKEIALMKDKLRDFQANWEPLLNMFE